MPCDYSKYPANWKIEIRPAILARDGNCCKFCKAPNYSIVCRGTWDGKEVYQNDDGYIFDAKDGRLIGEDYVGEVFTNERKKLTRIILTIMHIDHNTSNNNYDNLAAGCQKCHLNYDKDLHKKNTRETINKKKKLQSLF